MKKKVYKLLGPTGEFYESDEPGKYAGWNGKRKSRRIFGRLDCTSEMRMNKENRVFFLTLDDALLAGYRPCKNCKP